MARVHPEGEWQDAALRLTDGSVLEHRLRNAGSADLVRPTLRRPGDADADTVFLSELAVYVHGLCGRRAHGFSIYWATHGELVYVLTGLTHCVRLYVESGRASESGPLFFDVPKVYVFESLDGDPAELTWAPEVRFEPISRRRPTARHLEWSLAAPLSRGDAGAAGRGRTVSPLDDDESGWLGWALPSFGEKVALAYAGLSAAVDASSGTAGVLLARCRELAARRCLRWSRGTTDLEDFFLARICLYGLGQEDEAEHLAEDLLGLLACRPSDGGGDGGGAAFDRHHRVYRKAAAVANVLTGLYERQDELPASDERLERHDPAARAAARYYERFLGVRQTTLYHGREFLRRFLASLSVAQSLPPLRLPFDAAAVGRASRADVGCVLRL
ncbi:T88 [Tupaiid betaherpesvirus 1]|uniref:T88 n=1 Tax=Tupaiid herpesvirus 1 (strain 1) TaxID=10397 RepID=Q91TK9_TUHV1|nr:T88 [Tupaiid betaherpesvirus 1]AAK57132.1 T88 [Tupaiid betaherpesvirus 1]